jgi:hypothetical protein
MMAPGLEFLTVTEPIPPEEATGAVRQPERRMDARATAGRYFILIDQ